VPGAEQPCSVFARFPGRIARKPGGPGQAAQIAMTRAVVES
jgi:hypothetical protein